jgi:hypothetical protein
VRKPILVAVLCLCIATSAKIYMGFVIGGPHFGHAAVHIVPFAIILAGVILGSRLAWQWGRFLGLVWGAIIILVLINVLQDMVKELKALVEAWPVVLQAIALVFFLLALSTRGAKEHFGLVCPECGSDKAKPGNFVFTKVICLECKAVWR